MFNGSLSIRELKQMASNNHIIVIDVKIAVPFTGCVKTSLSNIYKVPDSILFQSNKISKKYVRMEWLTTVYKNLIKTEIT